MINKLTYFYEPEDKSNVERAELYSVESWGDLFSKMVVIEPHCFLIAGLVSQYIRKTKLEGLSAVSIGIDLTKEYFWAKANQLRLNVCDIDSESVTAAKDFIARNENVNVDYTHSNVLEDSDWVIGRHDFAILCQMDYVFSDEDIRALSAKMYQADISKIILISPSIFRFSLTNPGELFDAILNVLRSLLPKYKRSELRPHKTLRRRLAFLKELFSEYYECVHTESVRYPSGRLYLIELTKRDLVR